MARITRLLSIVVCSFLSAMAFVGDLLVDTVNTDMPPLLDPSNSLHADRALRVTHAEPVIGLSVAGPMFTDRARDHDRFIGDGFTNMGGGAALPI